MEISNEFLEKAAQEFREGDLLQASEKAWGAFAHYVKSVAREQGWPNSSHRDVNENASKIIDMMPDPERYKLMLRAMNGLHLNFYEDVFPAGVIEGGIADARALVDAMKVVVETKFGA